MTAATSSATTTAVTDKALATPSPEAQQETTIEWILWKHCWDQHNFQSNEDWEHNANEMSHFFAHHAVISKNHSDDNNDKNNSNDDKVSPPAPSGSVGQPFHQDLHHLPMPSKSFFLKTTRNTVGEHRVGNQHTEYSLFQKGVRPAWEDPTCTGQLFVKHYFPPELLDDYWHKLAHGVMEGKIDDQYVCGIRIVDKSKGKHPMYKMELWLNTSDPNVRGIVRKQALSCVPQDDHFRFNFHWREFPKSDATTGAPAVAVTDGTLPQGGAMTTAPTTEGEWKVV